jgi:hypothetical protein
MTATIKIRLDIEEEPTPVRGNALASGDAAVDKACEDEILRRLESGDQAAWFCAIVTATYGGFTGRDVLGGCSCVSIDDFKADAYYDDMKGRAIENLKSNMQAAVLAGNEARRTLKAIKGAKVEEE